MTGKIGAGSSLEEILALQRHAMTGLLRSQAIARGALDIYEQSLHYVIPIKAYKHKQFLHEYIRLGRG